MSEKFSNLMIDLETLSTRANGTVVAVGAVFFNPATGKLGPTFDGAIDMADAVRYGKVDGETLKWWFGQSDAAGKGMIRGRHTAEKVWSEFVKFASQFGKDVQPWGNGSSFDITMCEWQIGVVLNQKAPWQFWNVRDVRTIKELAKGIVKFDDKLEATAHTALDDAIFQAKYVSAFYQGLRAGPESPKAFQNIVKAKMDADEDDFEITLDD